MTTTPTPSWHRRVTATVAVAALLGATIPGCASDEAAPPASASGLVTVTVRAATELGVLRDVMAEHVPAADLQLEAVTYVLADGRCTTDAAAALAAPGFTVELGTGARLELRRDGDVFEVVGAPAPADPRLPPVRTLQVDGTVARFHVGDRDWHGRAADVEIALAGLPPETAARDTAAFAIALVASSSLERPQALPAVIIAILGVGWLAFCGGALARCAFDICECYRGYRMTCLGFTLTYTDGEWDVEYEGPECECVGDRIPDCDES